MQLDFCYIESPIGKLLASADHSGICFLEFIDGSDLTIAELSLRLKKDPLDIHFNISNLLNQLILELNEYFAGLRKSFTVPLSFYGTDFQKKVWNELLKIPFGTTSSYQQQAIRLGNLAAIRAVAHANGTNKLAILVPCHRVIGSDGNLTGYAGGLWRKKFLLELEQSNSKQLALFSS
ncbi:MAG: methylated-DNA--[protein]-cysteine S-methyltransferase [Saprospiraceae bacterium]|nr:methylated-DNA--[protein]-cysteine S-methyltransferase [Saprospiraceae bacterium]